MTAERQIDGNLAIHSAIDVNLPAMDIRAIVRHTGHVLARGGQVEEEERYYEAKRQLAESAIDLHCFSPQKY
jgi:hypothetical protein